MSEQVVEILAKYHQAVREYNEAKEQLATLGNYVSLSVVSLDSVAQYRERVARTSVIVGTLESVLCILSPEFKAETERRTQEMIASFVSKK